MNCSIWIDVIWSDSQIMIIVFQDFGTPQHLSGVILMSIMNTSCCCWLSSDDLMSWQHGRQRNTSICCSPRLYLFPQHMLIYWSHPHVKFNLSVAVDIYANVFPLPSYQLDTNPSLPQPLSNNTSSLYCGSPLHCGSCTILPIYLINSPTENKYIPNSISIAYPQHNNR